MFYFYAEPAMSRQSNSSDGNGGPGKGLAKLVAEWKLIWDRITDLVGRLGEVLEAFGRLIIEVAEVGRLIAGFFAKNSGRWLVVPFALGISSPILHAWGIDYLAESQLRTWSPVVVLPLLSIFLWASFKSVASDSERLFGGQQQGNVEPEVANELSVQTRQRQLGDQALREGKAGEGSGARRGIALNDDVRVQDVMSSRYLRFIRNLSDDFILVLLEISQAGATLLEKRGFVDEDLEGSLELPLEHFLDGNKGFDSVTEPHGYQCQPVAFTLGGCQYVLLGISGVDIRDLWLVELSRTATEIVASHVFGEKIPQWMVAEA